MNENTFNYNNPAMRFLTNIFNMFWVNLLFFFTCIPIITIGPSLCALYRVCLKIISGEDPMVYQTYFTEFKNSFKKGMLLWIIVLVAGFFFGYELYLIYFSDAIPDNLSFLQYPVWIMLLLVIQIFLYGFALMSVFENSFKNTIVNSILLSIKHIPSTILMIAIWLFTPLLVNTFPQTFYGVIGCELFFNLALRVYICSVFLHKAFDLKKIKVSKSGVAYEQSYDDLIEYIDPDEKEGDKDEDEEEYEPDELDDIEEDDEDGSDEYEEDDDSDEEDDEDTDEDDDDDEESESDEEEEEN